MHPAFVLWRRRVNAQDGIQASDSVASALVFQLQVLAWANVMNHIRIGDGTAEEMRPSTSVLDIGLVFCCGIHALSTVILQAAPMACV